MGLNMDGLVRRSERRTQKLVVLALVVLAVGLLTHLPRFITFGVAGTLMVSALILRWLTNRVVATIERNRARRR